MIVERREGEIVKQEFYARYSPPLSPLRVVPFTQWQPSSNERKVLERLKRLMRNVR